MNTTYEIECRRTGGGCGYHGTAKVVAQHTDGHAIVCCPKCRSTNVAIVRVNGNGTLKAVHLFARKNYGGTR